MMHHTFSGGGAAHHTAAIMIARQHSIDDDSGGGGSGSGGKIINCNEDNVNHYHTTTTTTTVANNGNNNNHKHHRRNITADSAIQLYSSGEQSFPLVGSDHQQLLSISTDSGFLDSDSNYNSTTVSRSSSQYSLFFGGGGGGIKPLPSSLSSNHNVHHRTKSSISAITTFDNDDDQHLYDSLDSDYHHQTSPSTTTSEDSEEDQLDFWNTYEHKPVAQNVIDLKLEQAKTVDIFNDQQYSLSSTTSGVEDATQESFTTVASNTTSTVGPNEPKLFQATSASIIDPPLFIKLLCYLSYGVLIFFGYVRNFLYQTGLWRPKYGGIRTEPNGRQGYAPLYNSWQGFFTEFIYRRVADIFGQPITGNPGGMVTVLERATPDWNRTFVLTGKKIECINLASYDYLGFSRKTDLNSIESSIRQYGVGVAPMAELGRTTKHQELERLLARFLGKEDCITFGMGFATNSNNILALVTDSADTLIIGDRHSHASIRAGLYLARATFRFFKHNDFVDLECQLRDALVHGNARTGRKWKKIIIIVEGVYSMEGTIVDLPKLLELKKRYKFYLYIDEAHSIGAVGPYGRGVCDYFGVDPTEVDVLMGTMTKSFAAAGGYITGSASLIAHIRANTISSYAGGMSAPVVQQVLDKLKILMCAAGMNYDAEEDADADADVKVDEDPEYRLIKRQQMANEGRQRVTQLLANTHYMREQLNKMGFLIYGHDDSPVIPIMVYFPAKVGSIVRMAVRNGLALVVAGYPATTLTTCRIRLCMSAQHSRATLDHALRILSYIGDVHRIKYAKRVTISKLFVATSTESSSSLLSSSTINNNNNSSKQSKCQNQLEYTNN